MCFFPSEVWVLKCAFIFYILLISAERGAALRSSDFPRMKGYRGWWAFPQDYMFEDEQNTSTLQQPLLPNWPVAESDVCDP